MDNTVTVKDWPTEYAALGGLASKIQQGAIPHAMLFVGSRAVTEPFTQYLAQVLLCHKDIKPCGQCIACLEFESGTHPDFLLVDGFATGRVKTGDIEELQEWLAVRPHYDRKKVYVIRGIDRTTPVAANRLLKTLEEPTSSVVAILTAVHSSLVLPTILSRCFVYSLQQDDDFLWQDTSTEMVFHSQSQSENSEFAAFLDKMVQWTEGWLVEKRPALILADDWMQLMSGIDQSEALNLLSAWFRDIMHVSVGETKQIRLKQFEPQMNRFAKVLDAAQWVQAIQHVLQTKTRIEAHVASLLNIEQMCIRLREVMRDV